MEFLYRFPTNPDILNKWQNVLNAHECCDSPWICINHFTPSDYVVSNKGKRFDLKPGVVPSVFDVIMIECAEDEIATIFGEEYQIEKKAEEIDLQEVLSQNDKLRQEIEQYKNQLKNQKIMLNSRVEYHKDIQKQQSKEIQDLKQQAECHRKSIEQLKTERGVTFAELNVDIFYLFVLLKRCFYLFLILLIFRWNKRK